MYYLKQPETELCRYANLGLSMRANKWRELGYSRHSHPNSFDVLKGDMSKRSSDQLVYVVFSEISQHIQQGQLGTLSPRPIRVDRA